MFKKHKLLKGISIFVLLLITGIFLFGFWFKGLIPPKDLAIETVSQNDLPYLSHNKIPKRGKVLAVVTSTATMGNSKKTTGYELTELARAYYTFEANGFEVDIASPQGGTSPVVIDDEDMGAYDYAFLNDSIAQYKATYTIALSEVIPEDYDAVYFAGGKGAMYDFPNNKNIQSIVKEYYQSNKVVGAVCHGPSALVNVTLDNGQSLLENKNISAFTNKEELLLIPDAATVFPFLLQDKLIESGATFNEGAMYLENISYNKNLVTGQNPWSTWGVVEGMVREMGYQPKPRKLTDEENAVKVLLVYQKYGKTKAKEMITSILIEDQKPLSRLLIAKHSIMAAMQWKLSDFYNLNGLVSFAKKCELQREKVQS